ncbi:MAG: heme-binding protein [Clostridia bacterium]|nr:heme-binding protein [Clostridia bacterium]
MNEKIIKDTVDAIVEEYVRPTNDMTLAAADRLCEKVLKYAKEKGVNAVVAISNKGGHPVCVKCADNSFIASYDIALNKAFTVVSLKMTTKELSTLAAPGGSLYGIQFTNGGRIVIFGGGEPLKNKNGDIIGGLGVSGGTEEQDTAIAKYGREIFEKGTK